MKEREYPHTTLSEIFGRISDFGPPDYERDGVKIYLHPDAAAKYNKLRELSINEPLHIIPMHEVPPEQEAKWEEELRLQALQDEQGQDELEEDREYEDAWGLEVERVKANPMLHRDTVYLEMLSEFCGDGNTLMWKHPHGDTEQVRLAKEFIGWHDLDVQGKIRALLTILDFQFSEPGIYTQEWFANAGDPCPPYAGGDFELDEDSFRPLSDLKEVLDSCSCSSGIHDHQDDEQYKGVISDRMPGWSDIEQAWMGSSNSSDLCFVRPYNWIRHWIVTGTNDPPILIDPHFIMRARGTPLPSLGDLVRGSLEFSENWEAWVDQVK